MEILEKKRFIKTITPFDKVDEDTLNQITSNLDIIYFKENATILSPKQKPDFLYFVIKGNIVQKNKHNEVIDSYSHNECFPPLSLIKNKIRYKFIATNESICYILPRDIFLSLLYDNEELENYFFQSISQKLIHHKSDETSKEFISFMVAKVKDVFLHKPIILSHTDSIYQGVELWKEHKDNSLLIENESGEIGLVTNTDLREKAILQKLDFDTPIAQIANYDILYINSDDFLFDAQIIMQKHHIKKLVVKENSKIIGLLDLTSLISFFASNTYSIRLEIQEASSLKELQSASSNISKTLRGLFAKGIKIKNISASTSHLNDLMLKKLFELTMPKELKDKCAFIVMGSEGRDEQILKTDQDNALIISDECDISEDKLEAFTAQFTKDICSLGYELCPGNIMLSNKYWCRKFSDFKELLETLIDRRSLEDLINLAIFYDSKTIYGDSILLNELKNYLYDNASNKISFSSKFASPIFNFSTPLGFFKHFVVDKGEHKNELDIKKGAIFAIVHGARVLSLENKIEALSTNTRLEKIIEKKILSKELGNELIEAFEFLSHLRLKFGLEKMDNNKKPDNYIAPNKLSSLEKDLLKDSFKIVDKFKKFLAFHYDMNR